MPRTYVTRFNFGAAFPDLVSRTTVRLHPRPEAPADPQASKMGGAIAWPRNEAWPSCEEHGSALVPVLQVRSEDVPELGFAEGSNLFQLLWCPTDHELTGYGPLAYAYWRDSSTLTELHAQGPPPENADDNYVCAPCNLSPECVVEYPSARSLELSKLEEIAGWLNQHATEDMEAIGIEPDVPGDSQNYQYHFSVAQGTKVGGYVAWIQDDVHPECTCGRRMDHLVTVASAEFDGAYERWLPMDERAVWGGPYEERRRVQSAAGLMIGDMGSLYVFVCRSCPGWPIWSITQCS